MAVPKKKISISKKKKKLYNLKKQLNFNFRTVNKKCIYCNNIKLFNTTCNSSCKYNLFLFGEIA